MCEQAEMGPDKDRSCHVLTGSAPLSALQDEGLHDLLECGRGRVSPGATSLTLAP